MRGVTEFYVIEEPLIRTADARKRNAIAGALHSTYAKAATWRKGSIEAVVRSPSQLLDVVFETGRKGIQLQRYKGLGEMNPNQLYETTLDDTQRTLLQVKVDHGDNADDLFAKLMGDVVEPRREFIQNNALNVSNLDV